ncbi:hypothetical protein D3C87_1219010 [compost metagenome]
MYIFPILRHHIAINNDCWQNTSHYLFPEQHSKFDYRPDNLIYYNFQQKEVILVREFEKR